MDRTRYCVNVVALVLVCVCGAVLCGDVFPDPTIPQNSSAGSHRSHGLKRALYYVIHDVGDPYTTTQWNDRVNVIRVGETYTRQFFAENSGGALDLYYDQVIDVPMTLNRDGTRPDGWRTLAKDYASDTLGINLNDYYANVFDVHDTAASAGQGWAGVYYGGKDLALQNILTDPNNPNQWGQIVVDHELGHRVSADHARAWRGLNDSNYHAYVWNDGTQSYDAYLPGTSPYHATPFGMRRDEYGNPFDTMGNISRGDFRVREKLDDLGWLTTGQVPDLDTLGEGTYRIYAHDELQWTTNRNGDYGVVDTYDAGVYYGLTFDRNAEDFDEGIGQFAPVTQTIDLEYRGGRDGVQFYLDGGILDLDPEGGTSRGNRERELELGQSIEDIDFGMSTFYVTEAGIDFLDYDPPAPSDPTVYRDEWFFFDVLGTGSDAVGSYVELSVSVSGPLNGIDGDLNQDGMVDGVDVDLFVAGWRVDTSRLPAVDKYYHGDLNFSGLTDLSDFWILHEGYNAANGEPLDSSLLMALLPEPSTQVLALLGLLAAGRRVRRRLAT